MSTKPGQLQRLVVSDAHEGLKQAIAEVLTGASWQRCRVHFMRNLLALVPKKAQTVTAAWVRTIFAQPDQTSARDQLDRGGPSSRIEAATSVSAPA